VKEALADHDPARARAAMREHVRRAGDLVAWWFAKWQDAEPIA
jgi:DNA-binding GntR family transcriptional regulator